MKLLLTSAGISNKSIEKALFDLVGQSFTDISLAYIPTASNLEMGDKTWLIDDLINLKNLKPKSLSIVDISAVEQNIWKPQLEEADVLFFEGGNTYHLMRWINKSGLNSMIPELLKTKVYVGVSAGSIVASKDLALSDAQKLFEEDLDEIGELAGLNLVDFYTIPHLNSPYFKNLREDIIRKEKKETTDKTYVLDDNSAVVVTDNKIEVVSEGEWFAVN